MADGEWINDDPGVKQFVKLAKKYYDGTVKFVKNGILYTAKLDPRKLRLSDCTACEAYFDINRGGRNKNTFILRMVEDDQVINITLM